MSWSSWCSRSTASSTMSVRRCATLSNSLRCKDRREYPVRKAIPACKASRGRKEKRDHKASKDQKARKESRDLRGSRGQQDRRGHRDQQVPTVRLVQMALMATMAGRRCLRSSATVRAASCNSPVGAVATALHRRVANLSARLDWSTTSPMRSTSVVPKDSRGSRDCKALSVRQALRGRKGYRVRKASLDPKERKVRPVPAVQVAPTVRMVTRAGRRCSRSLATARDVYCEFRRGPAAPGHRQQAGNTSARLDWSQRHRRCGRHPWLARAARACRC